MSGLALVASLVFQPPGVVDSPGEAFARAEAHYREGRYEDAAEIYETLRRSGVEDGVVYYNLGNAYFKAGRLGLAVLSYERARKLLPGDEDVRANLRFASEQVAGELEERPLPLVIGWTVDLYERLGPGDVAVVLTASVLLGGLLVSVLLVGRWPGRRPLALYGLAATGTVAVLAASTLALKLASDRGRIEAVVLSDNAYVRSGPGETSPRLAEIHEGLKVRVLGEREGWLQVSLANGLTGWLPLDDVERI